MSKLTLEPAQISHADDIVEMMSQLYLHEELPFDRTTCRKNVGLLIEDEGKGQIFLIKESQAVVGYGVIILFFSLEFGGLAGMLDEFFIEDEYRGKGIGTDAVKALIDHCRIKGLAGMQLEVLSANHRARNLYLKNGFATRERQIMACNLNRPDMQLLAG